MLSVQRKRKASPFLNTPLPREEASPQQTEAQEEEGEQREEEQKQEQEEQEAKEENQPSEQSEEQKTQNEPSSEPPALSVQEATPLHHRRSSSVTEPTEAQTVRKERFLEFSLFSCIVRTRAKDSTFGRKKTRL